MNDELPPRKIIHLDMDCFYAAIEVRDRPELRGLPVAVGGRRTNRGVLTTCTYEARAFGVRSAMPTFQALQLCPQLIVVPVRGEVYRAESARIRELMREFTPLIEPLSLDEAYLDITALPHPAAAVAAELRDRIYEATGLTASAGLGPNKLLAKIASDWNKPNGQFEVTDAATFMPPLPVRRLWGIGSVSAAKLERLGVRTCGDLQRFTQIELHQLFGKFGLELYRLCRGLDDRAVEPHQQRKSLSTEETFATDLHTLVECENRLRELHLELLRDLAKRRDLTPMRKLFVKMRWADFTRTTVECLGATPDLDEYLRLVGIAWRRREHPVRLLGLGVRMEEPTEPDPQLELFVESGGSSDLENF